jgi:hypothetical protein
VVSFLNTHSTTKESVEISGKGGGKLADSFSGGFAVIRRMLIPSWVKYVCLGIVIVELSICCAGLRPGPRFYLRRHVAEQMVRRLRDATIEFKDRVGRWPATLKELEQEKIVRKVELDPWGCPYGFMIIEGKPVVRCLGKDSVGGTDDDIVSLSLP